MSQTPSRVQRLAPDWSLITADWWAVITAIVLAVLVGFDLLPPVGW